MLRLGHIDYSNCFPVHALLLDRAPPEMLELCRGVPAELNRALAEGRVDVAPASSIEYARHAGRYRLLPDLTIASAGPVGSILLESARPLEELDGADVALPTASATAVVLLRLLLEQHTGVRPRYRWFEQGVEDPLHAGCAAALWIGDVALQRTGSTPQTFTDLGAAWTEWTGLPFVYALWQTSAGTERDTELAELHELLLTSRAYFETNADALAERNAQRFGLPAARLASYWRSLGYALGAREREGLLEFYRMAAELREAPAVTELRWIPTSR